MATCGFFGNRMIDIARRHRLNVIELRAPFGRAVPNEQIIEALADASRGAAGRGRARRDLDRAWRTRSSSWATAMRGSDALLLADCVTSLGGMPLEAEGWGVDYCYSCSQKCLGAPPGISPVSLSERAMERIRSRTQPVPFSFDFELLAQYWIERPAIYHHTTPNTQYYALYEGLRLALEEGLEARWARHAEAGAHLQAGLADRGYRLLADPEVQLAQLSAVCVPGGRGRQGRPDADAARAQHRGGRRPRAGRAGHLADRHDGHQRAHRDRRPAARGVRLRC